MDFFLSIFFISNTRILSIFIGSNGNPGEKKNGWRQTWTKKNGCGDARIFH